MTALRASVLATAFAAALLAAGCGPSAAPAPVGATAAPTSQQATAALSEAQVRSLVESVEAATVRKDVAGTAAHFADDIAITVVMPTAEGGSNTSVRNKAEFIDEETKALTEIPDARYASQITDVVVAPDGASAQARLNAQQSFTQDGSRVEVTAEQKFTIEMRNGQPAVVAVHTNVNGLTIDGNKAF